MKPAYTSTRHDPNVEQWGDCCRAAVATVLEMDPATVPHFFDKGVSGEEGRKLVRDFLKEHGYSLAEFAFTAPPDEVREHMEHQCEDTVYFLIGGGSYGRSDHVVVCRGGEIVHDPSPGGGGVTRPCAETGITWLWLIVPRRYGQ